MILSYTTVQDANSLFKYRFEENCRYIVDYLLDTMGGRFIECPPLLPMNKQYYLPKKQLFQNKYLYTIASYSTDFNLKFLNNEPLVFICVKSLDIRYINKDFIFIQSKKTCFNKTNPIVRFLSDSRNEFLISADETKITVIVGDRND